MISHAQRTECVDPMGIQYRIDDGSTLSTVADASVEWVTAALSLNNIPDLNGALTAINRVLRRQGHLVFTIPHPCFDAPNATSDEAEGSFRRRVGDYLAEGFWRSGHSHSVRRAGNHHRMVSTYLGTLLRTGFRIESIREPAPTPAVLRSNPHRGELPPFLLVHARRGLSRNRDRQRPACSTDSSWASSSANVKVPVGRSFLPSRYRRLTAASMPSAIASRDWLVASMARSCELVT